LAEEVRFELSLQFLPDTRTPPVSHRETRDMRVAAGVEETVDQHILLGAISAAIVEFPKTDTG
jgi:hypothetical protein